MCVEGSRTSCWVCSRRRCGGRSVGSPKRFTSSASHRKGAWGARPPPRARIRERTPRAQTRARTDTGGAAASLVSHRAVTNLAMRRAQARPGPAELRRRRPAVCAPLHEASDLWTLLSLRTAPRRRPRPSKALETESPLSRPSAHGSESHCCTRGAHWSLSHCCTPTLSRTSLTADRPTPPRKATQSLPRPHCLSPHQPQPLHKLTHRPPPPRPPPASRRVHLPVVGPRAYRLELRLERLPHPHPRSAKPVTAAPHRRPRPRACLRLSCALHRPTPPCPPPRRKGRGAPCKTSGARRRPSAQAVPG